MRTASIARLALASCLLLTFPATGMTQRLEAPAWVESHARQIAASPAVERSAEALLERTLAGASAREQIAAMARIRADTAMPAAQRDAVLHRYVEQLRDFAPATVPQPVLDWLAQAPPLAITGHPEGTHHGVALFNVARAARGLTNEWSWRRGHDDVTGIAPLSPDTLAELLGRLPANSPQFRGARYAIGRLPVHDLEALASHCAATLDGCGRARADIELARGNVAWLETWVTSASRTNAVPLLRRAGRFLAPSDAGALMKAAVAHPDKAVAAWAMSELTSSMPKDETLRREWGSRLVSLLGDTELGAAAALQLARMDTTDWLEAATKQPLGEDARMRLELLAELEDAVKMNEPDRGARR